MDEDVLVLLMGFIAIALFFIGTMVGTAFPMWTTAGEREMGNAMCQEQGMGVFERYDEGSNVVICKRVLQKNYGELTVIEDEAEREYKQR